MTRKLKNNPTSFLVLCTGIGLGILFSGEARIHAQERSDTVSLVFVGDVMMHKAQLDYDCTTFLEPIRPLLSKADIAVANLEFSLGGEPHTGYPAFSAPDAYAQYLSDCGIDVFLTANNHILDRGLKGYERTLDIYRKMGKMPDFLDSKGIRIGFLNFSYGTNAPHIEKQSGIRLTDRDSLASDIRRLHAFNVDFIVAFPHWGIEYKTHSNASQQKLAEWLARQGVDCILGSHPHVVQDTSHFCGQGGKKVPVVYSVGNCVSNMSARNTRLGLLVTLRFVKQGKEMKMLEPELSWLWCTLPGRLKNTYMTIPVAEYINRRDEWLNPSDYDNMIQTLKRYEENH